MKKQFKKMTVLVVVALMAMTIILPSQSMASVNVDKLVPKLPTPTIYSPEMSYKTTDQSTVITGVTFNDTRVVVYIDNTFNGYATVAEDDSGVASWSYKPFLPLRYGVHTVFTRAESLSDTKRSETSTPVTFSVVHNYPAPTVIGTVVNEETDYNQPFVVGLVKNDSVVKFYIDGELNGQVKVVNHESGTANFKYLPASDLTVGYHMVYAVAYDLDNKASKPSVTINFYITDPSFVVPETTTSQSENVVSESEGQLNTESDESSQENSSTTVEENEEDPEESAGISESTKQVVGWGILGVLLVGIVYQRRNTIGRVFKKKKTDGSKVDVEVITKDSKKDKSWDPKPENQNKKDDSDNGPTPPPPASHY